MEYLEQKIDRWSINIFPLHIYDTRAVGRSENPGVPVLFGRHNLSPLVEIGLTDLTKSGVVMAPPAPLETTRPGDNTPVLSR